MSKGMLFNKRENSCHRIDVKEFDSSNVPNSLPEKEQYKSTRNWSGMLGFAGTLAIHGVAIQSVVFGSALHRPRTPESHGGVVVGVNKAPPEDLVLVTVDDRSKADRGLWDQIASLGSHLDNLTISISNLDSVPIELASPDESDATPSQGTPDAADAALRALMFGRYMGQISARIERAWVRPRTPVKQTAQASIRSDADIGAHNEVFTCRVQIRQDARGAVQEVLLLTCDGTEAWRHSLVVAINQSSPLPAPPLASVFTKALTMTFEAREYRPGSDPDEYEIETRRSIASTAGSTTRQ